jgi:hypothetical protein
MSRWVKTINRWSTGGSSDEKKKSGNQGDAPEGKHGGGGSIHDWERVKESIFREF